MLPAAKFLTIFLVTNNYRPYSGGVVSSVEVLCNELKKRGHTVFIITLDFLGPEQGPEINIIRIPSLIRFKYKGNHMAIPCRADSHMQRLVATLKPDIIHVHHPFLLGVTAFKAAKQKNIPIVFTYHTQYESYLHYVPLPQPITYFLLKKRLHTFCKAVDALVFPRAFLADHVKKKFGIKNYYTVIPSSIDEQFFAPSTVSPSNKEWVLLTVSRFTPEKNLFFLLRVIKLLSSLPIVLKLVGYGTQLEELKHYAYNELELSIRTVIFIIKPPKNMLIDVYKSAHLFLFSSLTETQGIVLAEALVSGLPVIALDAPAQRECIEQGFNGFLVNSEYEMKEKIELLRKDKELYKTLKEEASKSGRLYHPTRYAHRVIDLYTNFLNKNAL